MPGLDAVDSEYEAALPGLYTEDSDDSDSEGDWGDHHQPVELGGYDSDSSVIIPVAAMAIHNAVETSILDSSSSNNYSNSSSSSGYCSLPVTYPIATSARRGL